MEIKRKRVKSVERGKGGREKRRKARRKKGRKGEERWSERRK